MAVGAFLRLFKAAVVLAREGVVTAAAPPDPPPAGRMVLALARLVERRADRPRPRGARVSDALNRLGPSYVKLGQFLATRPDLIGPRLADDLEVLQDQVAPLPLADVRGIIEADLGRPLDEAFETISEAVAAASVAQVHKARVRDADGGTRDVAVKVLRPGVEGRFHRDLDSFYLAARAMERFAPALRRLRPVAVVDVLARSVRLEMDLRMEAAAISEMAENTGGDSGFGLPQVDWHRTAKNVLTLSWIDGIKISDIPALTAAGHDLKGLARTVIQSFLRHAMRDGFFHADMHQGNLFVDAAGRLIAVDFGIVGRLIPEDRRFLAEILYGFITRDYLRVSRMHFEAGLVPPTERMEDFAQAVRAIGEPIRDRRAADISIGHLLGQLLDYTAVFNMKTQPRLVLLQKTMVVVEGVARRLDPDLDIWTVSEPVVSDWIAGNLGPRAALGDVADGAAALVRLGRSLPEMVERIDTISAGFSDMIRSGLVLDAGTVDEIAAAEARRTRSGRLALWLIAGCVLLIALKLYL